MIIARSSVDLIVKAKDDAFETAVRVLGESRELVVAAKQCEIDALKAQLSTAEAALKYERARADALVDRLLVRDAKVAAVAPAAVAAAVESDIALGKKRDEVQKIFDNLATVGAEPPPGEPRAFTFAGGGKGVSTG